MMSDIPEDLMRELIESFQVEAVEHLQTLNQSLLRLERATEDKERQTLVQDAFRAAHSLKGAARAVTMEQVEALSHSLESVLQQARDTDATLDANLYDVMYEMIDGIQAILDGHSADVGALQDGLEAAVDGRPIPRAASINDDNGGEAVSETYLETPVAETEPPASHAIPEAGEPPVDSGDEGGFRTISDDTIRVTVSKLDTIMAQSGELVVSKISTEERLNELQAVRELLMQWPRTQREIRTAVDHLSAEESARLKQLLEPHYKQLDTVSKSLETLERSLHSDTVRLGMTIDDLQSDIRRVRMLPLQTIALGLERAVRDAARVEGKQVAFSVDGGHVELDKKVLETLKDPLLHLLRNAVGHGIEAPEAREAAGKPAEGQITLVVRQRGSEVSLAVSDDGHGFDLEALQAAGAANGDLSADDSVSLAFMPGVTTSQQVTAISGRGVGLDVVRQRIESIHGRIAVDTVPGDGTTIELVVPTSLAMTRALLIQVGTERFALPLLSIERIVESVDTFSVNGKQMIRINETPLPLVPLASVLGRPGLQNGHTNVLLAVVISVADQRLAIQVDNIMTELELAVKPIGYPLQRVRNVAGAALLGSGEPVVVLNPADLIRSSRGVSTPNVQITRHEKDVDEVINRILVVDDSITTRTLEKNILEAAGFHVTTAIDGVEALKRLEAEPIDLVVTDIEMPNMNGFSLTRNIRDHGEFSRLPVILVTSLESEQDREAGMEAGADAYIIKRGFNQANLLTTIRQFLNGTD